MHEFEFIARYLAPLAGESSFGLKDDAALLHTPPGFELAVTKDALVQGVHFLGNETPADIARKSLRVNLSDCAAMGATPLAYMLALMLPERADEGWLCSFAEGLKADQHEFRITLLGGDTTRTPGPFALSVTLFGLVPTGKALLRNGARVGDDVYVSGTIGDAALGLHVAKNESGDDYLLQRYRLPQPRITLGEHLRGIASACMDISDGLLQDLEHICTASGTGADIDWENVPLSDAARNSGADAQTILSGGDDYELLFTASPAMREKINKLVAFAPVTRIGSITDGTVVRVLDDKIEMPITRKGYRHF